MGSKTPENERHGHQGGQGGPVPSNRSGESAGTSTNGAAGSGCLAGEDDEDADGDDDGGQVKSLVLAPVTDTGDQTTKSKGKKKKRKPKKKSTATSTQAQTSPPTIPLSQLFPDGVYAQGELQEYAQVTEVTTRVSAAELRYDARQYWNDDAFLQNYRKAAEVHRQARKWVHDSVKPGDTLLHIANTIEDGVRALLDNQGLGAGDGLRSGLAFPTGLCRNHEVAHYTPNPGHKDVVLQQKDVLTIDFGVHIDGWIVDSAFTIAFDPVYDNLLAAVKDATNSGIKAAGVDVRICDVSAVIQETMESYEVEIGGHTYPVKPVRNLCGHNIQRYRIHGGKSIPMVKNRDTTRMEEGEVFAIETFGSTGRGKTFDDVGVYGYSLNEDAPLRVPVGLSSARALHKTIRDNFGTIPFCRRYLERLGVERYLAGMNCLVANGIVEQYAPLADVKGSYSAQFEHTLLLRETHKEVLSRGEDY